MIIHFLFVQPILILIFMVFFFPVIIVLTWTTGIFLFAVIGVALAAASVVIGIIGVVFLGASIYKVVSAYINEIVFLSATFLEMLILSGIPFPLTYFGYLYYFSIDRDIS